MAKKKATKVALVFTGAFQTREGGIGYGYKQLAAWEPYEKNDEDLVQVSFLDETDRAFAKPLNAGYVQPGSVYEYEAFIKGEAFSVVTGSGVWVGRYDNDDKVAQWQIEHRAALDAHRLAAREKRAVKDRLDYRRLDPFVYAYAQARGFKRTLILMRVISYIVKGG